MKPLGVLHVIPSVSPREGGPSHALAMMERALHDSGVRVTTVTTSHDLCAVAPAHWATRIYARLWARPYKVAPGILAALLANMRSHDVVHIHALFSFSSTIAAWTARLLGVPYVLRPLGTLDGWGVQNRRARLKRLSIALIEGPNLRAAAAVHFTSEREMQEAQRLGLSFRGFVIPLGVDEPVDDMSSLASPLPRALAQRRVILFLSRLSPKKNIETLIDAFARSDVLRKNAALLVAGSGEADYEERLRARAREAGVAEAICWLGHVEGAAKAAALRAADLFVLPSFSENFGIAAAEALQAGVPCVLTADVAIAADAERAGAAVVAPPDAAALSEVLERLVADEAALRCMSEQARRFARATWSTSTMAQRLIELYENIAVRRRRFEG